MTTLPAAISSRTRTGSTFAMRARPWVESVRMPACAPVSEMAGTPDRLERHRHERAAHVLAGGQQEVHLARVGVIGDACRELEQVVGGVAHGADHDHEVGAGGSLARDPPGDVADAVGVREGRAAVLLDDQLGHAPIVAKTPAGPALAGPQPVLVDMTNTRAGRV